MCSQSMLAVGIVALFGAFSHAGGGPLQGNWVEVSNHGRFSPRDTASGTVHAGKLWLRNVHYHGNVLIRDLWSSNDGAQWQRVLDDTSYDGYSDITSFNGKLWAVKASV